MKKKHTGKPAPIEAPDPEEIARLASTVTGRGALRAYLMTLRIARNKFDARAQQVIPEIRKSLETVEREHREGMARFAAVIEPIEKALGETQA